MTISELTLKSSDHEPARTFEVFTGSDRRREWLPEEKGKTVCPPLSVRWLALHCASEGCFSIRRVEVKRLFEPSASSALRIFRGVLLLSGIGAWALPKWGIQENEVEQSRTRPDRCDATGTATLANSPHSSSREGRPFSTGRWNLMG
ncbi:hypothetical protein MESS4_330068 [Mesorhizobium sp. STM 4661]|nr:hypothetical protein MESS4_330068 [Mesorhizobium sp. STM 4661]